MAREAKKDPSELTVEEKLKALYQLQTMLSEIDKIKTLRGELPLEVQDLEDEVAGLSTRIEKIKADIEELKSNIATKKIEIETAKTSVEKYKAQQDNVRNNREYDVLTKEIEFQSLEIELCEKRIKEYIAAEKAKSEEIEHSNQDLDERKKKYWKQLSNRVCCRRLNVSVKILEMDWELCMFSVMHVVVVLTRFRPRNSLISVCVRKLSYVNIVVVS